MLKILKEILHTGNATTKYPFAPIEHPKDSRGKPEHDAVMCIACGACAVACPPNAIQMVLDLGAGTRTWSINYGRCIFCGRCEEVCPTKAIKLIPEFELAVFDKNDLEETSTYKLQTCAICGEYFAPEKEVAYAASILSQAGSGIEAEQAKELVGVCPKCKQKQDAYRAKKRSDTLGGQL